MLTWPVAVLGWVTSIIQQAEASQKELMNFYKRNLKYKTRHYSNSNTMEI